MSKYILVFFMLTSAAFADNLDDRIYSDYKKYVCTNCNRDINKDSVYGRGVYKNKKEYREMERYYRNRKPYLIDKEIYNESDKKDNNKTQDNN